MHDTHTHTFTHTIHLLDDDPHGIATSRGRAGSSTPLRRSPNSHCLDRHGGVPRQLQTSNSYRARSGRRSMRGPAWSIKRQNSSITEKDGRRRRNSEDIPGGATLPKELEDLQSATAKPIRISTEPRAAPRPRGAPPRWPW